MRKFLLICAVALLVAPLQSCDPEAEYTIIYVVRHAEKLDDSDPNSLLSELGHERAEALAERLADVPLTAVYHTDIMRTRQTAQPTANAQEIITTEFSWQQHEEMVAHLLENHSGSSVLVVGHSNTVGPTIEALGGEPFGELPDGEYDNLWIVIHGSNGKTVYESVKYP